MLPSIWIELCRSRTRPWPAAKGGDEYSKELGKNAGGDQGEGMGDGPNGGQDVKRQAGNKRDEDEGDGGGGGDGDGVHGQCERVADGRRRRR